MKILTITLLLTFLLTINLMARSKKVLSEQYMLKALQLKENKKYKESIKYFSWYDKESGGEE